MTDLAIMILNFNTRDLLASCLKSVLKGNKSQDVWVIDNGSSDGSVDMVKKKYPGVSLLLNGQNLGYSKGYNQALKKVVANSYLLLNSDTKLNEDSVINLKGCLAETKYSIISSKIIYPDRKFQPNAGDLPFGFALISWLSGADDLFRKIGINLPSFHRIDKTYYEGKSVGWVSGTAFVVKREVLDKIGYFDENIFMYSEDVDFCIRAKKAGFVIGVCQGSEITHLGGGSLDDPKFSQWLGEMRGLIYIYRKYYGVFYSLLLWLTLIFFLFLRTVAFYILGRKEVSKSYAKIIFAL